MIVSLLNFKVTKVGEAHSAQVTAVAGATGGNETFAFDIVGEQVSKSEQFNPNDVKDIVVTHHQNVRGVVSVTASPSGMSRNCFLDCSAASDQC